VAPVREQPAKQESDSLIIITKNNDLQSHYQCPVKSSDIDAIVHHKWSATESVAGAAADAIVRFARTKLSLPPIGELGGNTPPGTG
jgi:hypothetical protein